MSLLRSTLLVSALTAASRVLGLARDIQIARLLGAGPVAEAFLAAFRLPDLVRKMVGEGGINAGFVPLYAAAAKRGGTAEATRFARRALLAALVAAGLLVVAIEIGAAFFVLALASGLAGTPETLELAVACMRLAAPLVFGFVTAAMLGAWLNAEGRFAAAAIVPAFFNLVMLAALALLAMLDLEPREAALALAASVGLSGLALIVPLGVAARDLLARPAAGAPMRASWREGARLAAFALPAVAAASAPQLILLGAMQVASYDPGALAWLYYADRVVQLPLSFIGTALGLVLLPAMARSLASGERDRFLALQNRTLEAALLLSLPAAAALVTIATPATRVLFARGAFGEADVAGTAATLAALSLGLPFAAAGKVLSQGFFAHGRAAVPLVSGLIGISVTLAAGFALGRGSGLLAPAFVPGAAAGLGFLVQAVWLAYGLRRAGLWRGDARLAKNLLRGLAATLVMTLAVLALVRLDALAIGPIAGDFLGALRLAVICLLGLAVYGFVAVALGAASRSDLALFRRKEEPPLA